ncbi:MAG: type II secretion system protein [Terrimicrobiaceae bacterium]
MTPELPSDETRRLSRGFTFVELLMALAIAAGVIATAVVAYQAATQVSSRSRSYGTVRLSDGVLFDFYGLSGFYVDTYFAPSYGRVAQAEILRDAFYEDLSHASAVYCLGRTLQTETAQRPSVIPINFNYDARRLDTPETFRLFLEESVPATAGYFSAYRGASASPNLSIYILMPSDSSSELWVRAIYEVDFVPAASPDGTYASVRRYQGTACTDYYDIFFPASTGSVAFAPLVAHFERSARLATPEGGSDLLKVAANRPFYFVWWPDPAAPELQARSVEAFPADDPRSAYAAMAGRTSFFLTVPMFPPL